MNPMKWKLHWQILGALILALALGIPLNLLGLQEAPGTLTLIGICDFFGELFMNALKMIVVPLVAASIIAGVIGMGGEGAFARLGFKTLGYYALSGMVAILIGLVAVNLIRPGDVSPEIAKEIVGQAKKPDAQFLATAEGASTQDLWGIFLRMFPPNILEAAANNGQLLGVITFSLLFGFFITKIPEKHREFQTNFWVSAQEVMLKLTNFIIAFAAIGVFGLVTPILIRTGFGLFVPIFVFFSTVLLALAVHFFIALPCFLWFFARISPIEHYKAMAPVLLTAFSTSSSASTLPLTMETVEEKAGVSNRIASFTLPLGATVNMDGTALYECVVVIFIAQIYGVIAGFDFTMAMQVNVVILALLTSVGVAGIPSASLVAIILILNVLGLPPEAIGIVWVTDRILDMCRTSVNVFSDTVGAAIIAKSEGEPVYPQEATTATNA